ncbi:MAG TPA: hypothetical protein VFJ57_13855 [Solirubrobacterales bacterium]|nr:hypothetical protein [Solirubrobacterales bacterium]
MTPDTDDRTDEDALHAVSDLIADAGPAPEAIASGYGKGLLVQTDHEGQMDASRLWVQVKGTAEIGSHRPNGDGLSLQVPFDDAMRWVRALDLVVVVLWDVVGDVGWYAIPSAQVDPVEGVNEGLKYVTLRFAEEDVLTSEAVDVLVWRARLENHRLLVLGARDAEQKEKGTKPSYRRAMTALDFTDLAGMTERRSGPNGVQYRVLPEVFTEFEEVLAKLPGEQGEEPEKRVRRAAHVVTSRRWKMIEPRQDLPNALLEEGAEIILTRLRQELEDPAARRFAEGWARRNRR